MIDCRSVTSKDEWEGFIQTHQEVNFLQSWYWGEFQQALGKHVEYMGFYEGDVLKGTALMVVESAKRAKYMTVAGGPLLDWSNSQLVKLCFEELKNVAKKHNVIFVRVRPQLIENEISLAIFRKHGFVSAPMHLSADLTSQLDITKTEDELLAKMRKTTRYELKKAQKLGITIQTSFNVDDIDGFYDRQIQTAKRQGFVPFSLKFLKEQFRAFSANNSALLYQAYYEKKLLAEAFIIFYGPEATYHYGASTEDGRKFPGAYLLQWEAILEAKRRGQKRYNFWGVVKPDQTKHRFYGVSIFKRGFGGDDVAYVHAQDLVIAPLRYTINYFFEHLRKKLRRLG